MPKFYYKKLVRNNIPGFHHESGHTVEGKMLENNELKLALISKLHEEADEIPVQDTADTAVIEEIADVQQVLDNLKQLYGIGDAALQEVMTKKRERKGDFLEGHYIETVYMPSDDKWVEYCRRSPEKYPELEE
jgi:predicted house-cleaning noncanonical NTP pyrophosphatase (MazG superfamily)